MMTITEINNNARELKELKLLRDELNNEITAIEDKIKAQMLEANTDSIVTTQFRITWKEVRTSRIDTTAMKLAMPDVCSQFVKETVARRFIIS